MLAIAAIVFLGYCVLSSRSISEGCESLGNGVVCYEGSKHKLLNEIVNKLVPTLGSVPDVAQDACVQSVRNSYHVIHEQSKFPVFVVKPGSCYSFGNMVGSFYEAISFGMKNNFIVFRSNGDCEGQPHNASMIAGLPQLYVPHTIANSLSEGICKSEMSSRSPWDSDKSLFWSYIPVISVLNRRMVSYYQQHSSISAPSIDEMHNTLALHYRCSDNVISHIYGVFPFSTYKNILAEIARKYVDRVQQRMDNGGHKTTTFTKIAIFSDAKESGAYGTLCWNLLGMLRDKIITLPGYQDMRVDIVYTTASSTILLMHHAKVLICSISTFCFFTAMGSEHSEFVYLPKSPRLLNTPETFWRQNSSAVQRILQFESPTMVKDEKSDWKSFIKRVSSS